MAHANLPALSDILFALPKKEGVWESNGLNLDSLARSLEAPREVLNDELKSVPDIWAQVQVFQDALESEGHPLHRMVVSQWRALISVLALGAQYAAHYEVELEPVDLTPGGGRAGGARFRSALHKLLPQASLHASASWEAPALLIVRPKVGGGRFGVVGEAQLLGLVNPACLIAAGKAAGALAVKGPPWLANGLVDPTSPEVSDPANDHGLRRKDYAILADYLSQLLRTLRAEPPTDRTLMSTMLSQLQAFLARCVELAGETPAATQPAPASSGPLLPFLFEALRAGFIAPPEDVLSHCLLAFRDDVPEGDRPFKGVILVDETLRATLGRSAHDIHVWKQHTLNEARTPALLKTIREEAHRDGYLVVEPRDFFTDELVRLEDGAEVGGHRLDGGFRTAVLPLTPLALLFLKPHELDERVSLAVAGGADHRVTFSLPVQGVGAGHRISCNFAETPASPADGLLVTDQPRPMGLAVWPDFYNPAWRWNFLRFQHDPGSSDLLTRFATSGRLFTAELNAAASGVLRAQAAASFLDRAACATALELTSERITPEGSPANVHRLRYRNRKDNVEELQVAAIGFEAVCLARRPAPDAAARPCGLILLNRRETPPAVADGIAAIDFGTTNTVAYVKSPNSHAAQEMVFRDRVVFPISDPSSDAQDRDLVKWTFVDFLPPSENRTPLPTVAKLPALEFDSDPGLENVQGLVDDRMLFASTVFFLPPKSAGRAPGGRDNDAQRLSANKDQLRFNLKWGESEDTRKISRRYLRQFAMMMGAEMLAGGLDPRRSKWRLSYPEALPGIDQFIAAFEGNLQTVFGTPPGGGVWRAETFTEAGAAAAYFLGQGGARGQLVVILDIGGGTTDVAIWSQERLRWRGSVKLAGGDFFTSYLYNNPELLDLGLKLPDLAAIIREKPNKEIVELFFHDRRFGPALDQHYNDISEALGAGVRVSALTALGGVLFYVGGVLRGLVKRGEIPEEDLQGLSLALGGRGSEIFRRFHRSGSPRQTALERLTTVLHAGAAPAPPGRPTAIVMTQAAKSEVVIGMTAEAEVLALAGETAPAAWTPIGETVRMRRGSEVVTIDANTDVNELAAMELEGRPGLQELDAFLNALDAAGIAIDLKGDGGDGRAEIADRTARVYRSALAKARVVLDAQKINLRTADRKGQLLEPVFMTELRALVEILASEERERRRFVTVREHS